MANRDLLKEAIADAKALKETAIANAKAALEEAFEPRLKSMLSAKLEEMEKEDMDEAYDEVDEMKYSKEEMTEETSEPHGNIGAQTPEGEPLGFLEEEDMDEEMDLDEILAELEEGEDKDDIKEADEDEEVEGEDEEVEAGDDEEEIDLEDMSEDDLKSFIEDVIADMVDAGELEAGDEFDAEDEMDSEDEIDIDVEDETEEIMEGEKEEMDEATLNEEPVSAMAIAAGMASILGGSALLAKVQDKMEKGDFGAKGKKVADFLDKMGSAASNATQLREEPVSAMAIATGMASILGGSALLATIQDKMEKGKFGEKGKKVADLLQKVSKGATAATQNLEEKDDMEEMMEEINSLRAELHEVNLLNAKLLYTNKIFRAKNLKEAQKVKVLEAFDKAETVKEAKLVFETMNSSLANAKKQVVKENLGRASKSSGIISQTKSNIVDVDPMFARMQKLAGLK